MQVTTKNTAASYTALLWLTGAPVGLDSAPTDLASVAAGRRMTIPAGIFVTSALIIAAYAYDGSSTTTGRFWWYDPTFDIWVPNGNVVTLTTASTNVGTAIIGCVPGMLHHYQVVANAGGTTKIAVLIR